MLIINIMIISESLPVCRYMWVFTARSSFTPVLHTSEVPELQNSALMESLQKPKLI